MGKLVLITGGARSGKSTFAESMAEAMSDKVLYLATAVAFDEEMQERVARHRQSRSAGWSTYEGYKELDSVIENSKAYQVLLLDCATVMLTNLLWEYPGLDFDHPSADIIEKAEEYVSKEFERLLVAAERFDGTLLIVTNELGNGLAPEARMARIFRDIAGRVNQQIAARSQEVYLIVCGIPIKIKGN